MEVIGLGFRDNDCGIDVHNVFAVEVHGLIDLSKDIFYKQEVGHIGKRHIKEVLEVLFQSSYKCWVILIRILI